MILEGISEGKKTAKSITLPARKIHKMIKRYENIENKGEIKTENVD